MMPPNGAEQKDVTTLEDVRRRLGFLCHDLRTFTSNPNAAQRLDTSVYPHFIGPPYLSEHAAQAALSSTLQALRDAAASPLPDPAAGVDCSKTLAVFLEEKTAAIVAAREAKRSQGGGKANDFVLCTSHDLAPILLEACAFPKEHFDTRAFKDAYKRWEKEARKANKKGAART